MQRTRSTTFMRPTNFRLRSYAILSLLLIVLFFRFSQNSIGRDKRAVYHPPRINPKFFKCHAVRRICVMFPVYVNTNDKSYPLMNSLLPADCLWHVQLFLSTSQKLPEKSGNFLDMRAHAFRLVTNIKLRKCCHRSKHLFYRKYSAVRSQMLKVCAKLRVRYFFETQSLKRK